MAKKIKEEVLTPVGDARYFYVKDGGYNLPVNVLFKVREFKSDKFINIPTWQFTKVKSKANQNLFCSRMEIFHLKMAMKDNMTHPVLYLYDDIDAALSDLTPTEKKREAEETAKVMEGVFSAPVENTDEKQAEKITQTERPKRKFKNVMAGSYIKSPHQVQKIKTGKAASNDVDTDANTNAYGKRVAPIKDITSGSPTKVSKTSPENLPYGLKHAEMKLLVTLAMEHQNFSKGKIKEVIKADSIEEQLRIIENFITHSLKYRSMVKPEHIPPLNILKKLGLDDKLLYHYERILNGKQIQEKDIVKVGNKKIDLGKLKKHGISGYAAFLAGKSIVGIAKGTSSAIGSASEKLALIQEQKAAAAKSAAGAIVSAEEKKAAQKAEKEAGTSEKETVVQNNTSEKIVERTREVERQAAQAEKEKAETAPEVLRSGRRGSIVTPTDDYTPKAMRSGRREKASIVDDTKDRIEIAKKEVDVFEKGMFDIFAKIEKRFLKPKAEGAKSDNKVVEAQAITPFGNEDIQTVQPTVAPSAAGLIVNASDAAGQEAPKQSFMGRIGDKLMDAGVDRLLSRKSPTTAPTPSQKPSPTGNKGFMSKLGGVGMKALKMGRGIPLLGTAIGAGFLAKSMWEGDTKGMAVNAASMIPGVGTAVAAADVANDVYQESKSSELEAVTKQRADEMETKQEQIQIAQAAEQSAQTQQVVDASKKTTIIQQGGGGQAMRHSPRTSDSTLRDYQRSRTRFSGAVA